MKGKQETVRFDRGRERGYEYIRITSSFNETEECMGDTEAVFSRKLTEKEKKLDAVSIFLGVLIALGIITFVFMVLLIGYAAYVMGGWVGLALIIIAFVMLLLPSR